MWKSVLGLQSHKGALDTTGSPLFTEKILALYKNYLVLEWKIFQFEGSFKCKLILTLEQFRRLYSSLGCGRRKTF